MRSRTCALLAAAALGCETHTETPPHLVTRDSTPSCTDPSIEPPADEPNYFAPTHFGFVRLSETFLVCKSAAGFVGRPDAADRYCYCLTGTISERSSEGPWHRAAVDDDLEKACSKETSEIASARALMARLAAKVFVACTRRAHAETEEQAEYAIEQCGCISDKTMAPFLSCSGTSTCATRAYEALGGLVDCNDAATCVRIADKVLAAGDFRCDLAAKHWVATKKHLTVRQFMALQVTREGD
jgi:hypothetical protein